MSFENVGRSQRRGVLVFILMVAVLGAMLVIRARHGMDWFMDEPYALDTPLRFLAGDHVIVDAWETHFSSAMLLTPFVWVVHQLSPGNEGIVLNFRYLFVFLQTVYTFIVWRVLRPVVREWWAIAIAGVVMVYLPFFYVFPYYNDIAVAAFTVSALLLLSTFAADRDRLPAGLMVASGVASGVGVIAYPTMLVAIPLFAVGIWLEVRARGRGLGGVRRPLLAYGLAVLGTLSLFAVVTLASSGGTHLAQSLPRFLRPDDRDVTMAAIATAYAKTWTLLITPAAAALAFLGYALVRGRERASAITAIATTTVAAIVVATLLYRERVPWLHYFDMPQACALGIGTALLLLPMLKRRPAITGRLLRLLALPTVGVALGTTLASHEGFEPATMPAIILAIGTFVALASALREGSGTPSTAGQEAGRPSSWRRQVVVAAGSLLLAFAFFLYGATQYVSADAPVRQLDTLLTTGPYKGIRTTAANAEQYASYERALGPLSREPGRIAFLEEFSLGYLMTARRPGTYSDGITYARGHRWQTYLDITGNYPTTIVATRVYGYGSKSDEDKVAPVPVPPPFGLRDFAQKYQEAYRDGDFVVYERVSGH